ncbi:DUF3408 domain-containing protein [uncultured Alistipes sp.]|uniref:DUF3408 domain-containing protein n=1 Tax=uncultured Alistipes sp. TaxID=538949 RepID=UPI00272CA9FE|nr:DUF3408 domain-containing protein [uncultured Alistipes sp.]
MAKKQNPRIDEELVRQMIGGQAPLTENVVVDTDSEPQPEDAPPPEAASAGTAEPRRRRAALPDFKKTFLLPQDNTRTSRSSIYVSAHIKRMITEVVKKIGQEHMTVTAYVDNILRHHLELYKDDINRIHKEQNSKNLI